MHFSPMRHAAWPPSPATSFGWPGQPRRTSSAWSDIRKRLDAGFRRWRGLNALEPDGLFEPFEDTGDDSFFEDLFLGLPDSAAAVWDPEAPGMLRREGEAHWLATHFAQMPGGWPASVEELAARARGRKAWGILRGDADQFQARLNKAESVEEYIQLSVFYKQFFAGEVQVLCGQEEFRDRVTVLYTGGDEFALAGSWDALLPFARAIERVFRRSVEEFLKEFPGVEGKTLSMGIALAPIRSSSLRSSTARRAVSWKPPRAPAATPSPSLEKCSTGNRWPRRPNSGT